MACCTHGVNKDVIGFVCQYLILFIVIATSLFNLTFGDRTARDIWLVLLSSSFGLACPSPSIKRKPTPTLGTTPIIATTPTPSVADAER